MTDDTSANGVPDSAAVPPKEDKAFLALKDEKKKIAQENADLKARLEKIESENRAKQEEALKQQGEYKKLWEDGQKSNSELADKLKAKEQKELALRKIDVVMQELGAPLAKPEYWDFVDLTSIPVDEATNDIDRNIAKKVASDFVKNFPELLAKKSGKLPSDAPSPASSLSYDDWAKLPLDEKRKRLKDVKR